MSIKILLAALIFAGGGILNLYFCGTLDRVFTARSGFEIPGFSECVQTVLTVEKAGELFLLVQGLIAVFSLYTAFIQNKSCCTDEVKVTDEIKIPASAGQGQHGSARFMTDREKRDFFQVFALNPADETVANLLKLGEKRRAETPQSDFAEENVYSEKEWETEQELARNGQEKCERRAEILNKLTKIIPIKKREAATRFFSFFSKIPAIKNAEKLRRKREISRHNPTAKKPIVMQSAGIVTGLEKAGKAEKIYCLGGDVHTLVIGSTGCGKTRCLVIQSICLLAVAGESIVASDPKGEIFAYTEPFLRELGYTVRVIDFQDADKSNCLNPLQGIIDAVCENDLDAARTRAWDLVCFLVERSEKGEPIWRNGEMSVLAAAVLCVVYDNKANPQYQNLTNAYRFIANMCRDVPRENAAANEPRTVKPILEYVKNLPDAHPAKPLLGISEIAPDKTAGSFYTSALTTLRLFITKGVYNITRKSDFQLDESGRQKTAFFYILPDENTTFYPVVTLLVSQQYEQLVKFAKSRGNRLPVRVNFVLDEFGNFVAISDFQAKMTVARGYGIRFSLFLQSLAQLTEKYGKETAEIIKGNCTAWVYLKAQDESTNEEISKQLGDYTTSSYSLGSSTQKFSSPSSSQNVSLVGRRLLFTSDLCRFRRPYQLVLTAANPAVTRSPDLSEWLFNKMLGLGGPKHNERIISFHKANRPDCAKNEKQQELWGIWNDWLPQNGQNDMQNSENRVANSNKKRVSAVGNLPQNRMVKMYEKEEKM